MLKGNRIEPGSQRRVKRHYPWILCGCNRQCYITLITGCYTCEWQVKQEKKSLPGPCCCSWREKLFYPFLITSFLLSLILLFVWIETSNEYFGFDWELPRTLNTEMGVLLGILSWPNSSSWTAPSNSSFSGLMIANLPTIWYLAEKGVLVLLVIVTISFFLWILFTYWRDRWLTTGLSLQIFAPYVHLSGITMMVILSWPVGFYLIHLEEEARIRRYKMANYDREKTKRCNTLTKLRALQVAIGLPFFLILLCLYVIPLGIHSPCIQEEGKLGPKPDFFGHRGAPMLGPENTMMSFEKAVEQGAWGLESDVQLSLDHVPFLMHDYDLRRTTNIKEVMPNASLTHPSFFHWSFLSTLNAGKWFVQSPLKPFYRMKALSKADRERAENQTIPKLIDLLELAQKEKKFVMFDLNAPPRKHPVRGTYIRRVVRLILDSKIEQHLIFWLPAFDREYVKQAAPGFQQVGRLYSIERLTKENISRINVDYKKLFYNGLRDYKAANIKINLYLVNEPWLYSLAWCSKIHSVTTDNIHILSQLDQPYFLMTPSYYMFMWLLLDSVSAVLIVTVFYFHWWREHKKEMADNASIHTDSQSVSHQKRELGSQESSNLSINPPFRVMEIPWTLASLYPALTKSRRKHPGSHHLLVVPKKKASEPEQVREVIKPLMPHEDAVRQLASPKKSFEPTWDDARNYTFQTALPPLKMNKPAVSSVETSQSEIESENIPKSKPSQESSLTMFSPTTSMFSTGLVSKKN
ncbi:glycerophosphodiester phosphodiesterase domain-containing protein 4 isoform X3 [Mustela erminea]|uniref:glycerophosphodiester phosphodiesterase domain-containing protein 4 isoform X3 n=2 Tax=Mustela erminea TaxID=36723 RepID=UPI001386DF7B|nr:glycerophosphodiester phosphodiesterase domain-containing protein 4 isoform X3 [Mustela erminea]